MPSMDSTERLRRMKLRRAGHPAPPARREPGGEYQEFAVEGGGLEEFGYPVEGCVFLVRTDVEAKPGDLVMIEREPFMYEGRVNQFDHEDDRICYGLLGVDGAGNFRLESLTCGAFGYTIKRIIGVVVGPVAEDSANTPAQPARLLQFPGCGAVKDEDADEWPEYIGREGGES